MLQWLVKYEIKLAFLICIVCMMLSCYQFKVPVSRPTVDSFPIIDYMKAL